MMGKLTRILMRPQDHAADHHRAQSLGVVFKGSHIGADTVIGSNAV
jgi:acetyltransferase-like isoleucine patch superfamily enzyme